VEYARAVIVSSLQTNQHARNLGTSKVLGTYKKSPRLLDRIYKDALPVYVNGRQTEVIRPERDRLRTVMEAIAFGMHFLHFERRFFGSWYFFSPEMISMEALKAMETDGLDDLRSAFRRAQVSPVQTKYPEIFDCGVHMEKGHILFKFQFYGGFYVFARGLPPHITPSIPRGAF
jgi:hypothetical protein